ncbi:MAG: DUF899 domain-containing protein, partial [Myxococcota bacterium]
TTPRKEWLEARRALLQLEKDHMRAGDALAQKRRALPRLRIEEAYEFDSPDGRLTLADLFEGKSQLLVYHFMYGPDWEAPCRSCSFWADHFGASVPHLAARDVAFCAVSRAPVEKLEAHKRRLGWTHRWVSSGNNSFNYDFDVSFGENHPKDEPTYNYRPMQGSMDEMPGLSVFVKDERGEIFHTYSTYARGLEAFNATYHLLDLVPKGRDEGTLDFTMAWIQFRDDYEQP